MIYGFKKLNGPEDWIDVVGKKKLEAASVRV